MRRAVLAVVATVAAVVAILSYHSPPASKPTVKPPTPLPPEVREFIGTRERAISPDRRIDYGAVQVAITVKAGRITAIRTPLLPPSDDRAGKGTWATSGLLSQGATRILVRKVLASQSAKVHTVSGATWTSEAFVTSLQAAMAEAGLSAAQ